MLSERTSQAVQTNLFDFAGIAPGQLVICKSSIYGRYQNAIPTWLIRETNHAKGEALACAFPFSQWPDERAWLRMGDLEPLGNPFDLPDTEDVEQMFDDAGFNLYRLHIGQSKTGACFVAKYDLARITHPYEVESWSDGQVKGAYIRLEPFELERPVIAELEARNIPWRAGAVTRDEWAKR